MSSMTKKEVCRMIKDHLGNEYKSVSAMAESYGIAQRTLHTRLKKMSVEEALTKPIGPSKRKNGCKDHLGNKYPSKSAMCNAYGIDKSLFFSRIKIGWTLEDALTAPMQKLPKNTKTVTDHKGQKFESVSAMCKHWKMTRSTYNARIKQGWSIEDALTKPKKDVNMAAQTCKDHLGNEYPSLNAMCRVYNISRYMYQERINSGWSLEKALTTPTIINAITCGDGFGHKFPSIRDMCNYYCIPVHTLQGNVTSEDETKNIILKKYKQGKVIGNITIKKSLPFPYYLVSIDNKEIIMTFDQILDSFHNSDYFNPIPETKVKHKQINSVSLIEFPYYSVNMNGKTNKISYWELMEYNKNSNFGLIAHKNIVIDHLGNEYSSMAAMLKHYDIGAVAFEYRMNKLGMSLEEALTTPKKENLSTAIACEDHLGNKFESKAAMCDYWRMPRTVYFRRIRDGWSQEKALTEPINHNHQNQTKMIKDHKGKQYYSIDEMCNNYGISKKQYMINIRNNCSIEKALTTKTTWTKCRDHLGNEYKSINAMCSKYGITKTTLRSRLELGWTLKEVLENPGKIPQAQKHTDHLGNVFESKDDMLKYHGISYATYSHRKKLGMPLEDCLKNENLHVVMRTDHKGNRFRSLKDMLEYWNSTNGIFASKIKKGYSIKDALTIIGKRRSNDFGPGIEIVKRIDAEHYIISLFGEKKEWHVDELFDYYRKSYLPNSGQDLILKEDDI